MIDLKNFLVNNNSVLNPNNPDINMDKVISNRRKILSQARSAIRDHLEQQFEEALKTFYSREIPEDRNKIY